MMAVRLNRIPMKVQARRKVNQMRGKLQHGQITVEQTQSHWLDQQETEMIPSIIHT